ncbi:MAG: hypothetical protein A2X35_01510 [Elusimicrobia bacterium GWA2_61_42]|nr:MAG: hypothetical protein A2X35_01510 [Elusimicrobia bacterium GWA2_61_42]OGR76824.1 MAG: hypothetical protein A2X38_11685 [Elusimicrobia bacterium GWC2_61_25]
MRLPIFSLLLLSGLLLSAAAPAAAGNKARAAKTSGYKEIPALNWGLTSAGFVELFKLRNMEIEGAAPSRFFPASVAFSLGRIDDTGHYLMLKCSASADCDGNRDALEERLMSATLLEVVLTPRVLKDQLYDPNTWALTPLGDKYIKILRKRYPDLSTRLARLVAAAFASQ